MSVVTDPAAQPSVMLMRGEKPSRTGESARISSRPAPHDRARPAFLSADEMFERWLALNPQWRCVTRNTGRAPRHCTVCRNAL
jgi:hypothetical protein